MASIRELLLQRAHDESPALHWRVGDDVRTLSWREYVGRAATLAATLEARLDPDRPPHVGVILGNTPEMALHLAAAGLGGHVLVGLNSTRRGAALATDATTADCQFVVTGREHTDLADATGLPVIEASTVDALDESEASAATPDADSLFMLIFTSGTGGTPKAVRVIHEKVTYPGAYLAEKLGLVGTDVHYVSTPLFHSNAVMAGWAPALTTGASVAVAAFSASRFIDDVRAFGATYANYVGKPLAHVLATPARPDDADNPLRVVFGNEAGDRDTAAFAARFRCAVIDGFGSTENAVVITRTPDTPPGALGRPLEGVAVLDTDGVECPPATYDEHGRVTNLDACVGELVNTTGAGQFAGYYNAPEATAERMRGGMYWSGDLGYRDPAGFVHYAGRTSDWLRVDGENLAAAPIERVLLRHPAISEAAVYAVPDRAGDSMAAALILTGPMRPEEFGRFLAEQDDLGVKEWPRHVLLADALPRTATTKVLKRKLPRDGFTWSRGERDRTYVEVG